ncbi:MAG: CAP domain-containing protein [Patescibacteria group bacterium]
MKKNLAVILIILAVISLYFFFNKINPDIQEIEKISLEVLGNPKELIEAPPPLKIYQGQILGDLSVKGIIILTNEQRAEQKLLALKENSKLNEAALIKAKDIIQRQYFDHISPSGVGPSDLAKEVNYHFLIMGENLALGDFRDDKNVVNAWMKSPGHRANILDSRFREIGVAVIKGRFNDQDVWVAVQEFGTPASLCTQPGQDLKEKIEDERKILDDLNAKLISLKNEIESSRYSRFIFRQKITEYNLLANQYNNLAETMKNDINLYNAEVIQYNRCLGGI